jgi:hypothetical protein
MLSFNLQVLLCIALAVLNTRGACSFLLVSQTHQLSKQPTTCSSRRNNDPLQGTTKDDDRLERDDTQDDDRLERDDDKSHDFHVIASDNVILPGEQTSLSLTDHDAVPLIQYVVLNDKPMVRVVVAVRVTTEDENGNLALAQVASLCEMTVSSINVEEDQVQVDLKCVGRVRLLNMLQQHNANIFQFKGEWIEEGFQDPKEVEKAKRVESNIERMMGEISRLEREIAERRSERGQLLLFSNPNNSPSSATRNLYDQYSKTKARLFRTMATAFDRQAEVMHGNNHNVLVSGNKDDDTMSLTATSWAVFPCLNDSKLEARYRLRALDWDNLLERIKLAQYVLREKCLLLQGQLLELQDDNSPPENYYGVSEDAFQ